jgi:hypothetical protein
MVMRRASGPNYNFFTRIGPESEERRRRLQEQLDLRESRGPEDGEGPVCRRRKAT